MKYPLTLCLDLHCTVLYNKSNFQNEIFFPAVPFSPLAAHESAIRTHFNRHDSYFLLCPTVKSAF